MWVLGFTLGQGRCFRVILGRSVSFTQLIKYLDVYLKLCCNSCHFTVKITVSSSITCYLCVFCFCPCHVACEILVPHRIWIEPPEWNRWVLTTRLSGKSRLCVFILHTTPSNEVSHIYQGVPPRFHLKREIKNQNAEVGRVSYLYTHAHGKITVICVHLF